MAVDTFTSTRSHRADHPGDTQPVHLYYPAEGFGATYRRFMLNDFFTDLIHRTNIHTVAEMPLDSYGIVGAGSLIFTQFGCEVTLVSDDQGVLDRARALMAFNSVSGVQYVHSSFYETALPDDAFDFTWSFDRLQALADQKRFLQELCRISKATMIVVPNAYNYGQYLHHIYHRLGGTTCEYVGPRAWMRRAPLCESLRQGGMAVLADGIIDAPWWPGFPELPNLIRGLLGRAPVGTGHLEVPEADLQVIPPEDLARMKQRVERSAFFERGRAWPAFIKLFFSHNVYALGCKPEKQRELGF